MLNQYANLKGYTLKSTPSASTNGLWVFKFTDGYTDRDVQFFDDQLVREAARGALSPDAKMKINDALA